ncbi:primosomal protein N' [Bifidobacterium aerophilum]|uniref:Primosomal protein N n=1 Tax=Bifidobacterium aerophilum TaxID=1798155 RepID=A0A6N9Z311_9BIFI|nr:primosomal protein N' [Bifidobacterium aerophilum]NEG88585.1 primosomal protein N' [Bifidobacterium aerophilum]
MTSPHAEQLTFDGFATPRRRRRAPEEKIPAAENPVVRVVLDVQATHLGRTFDYLVEERQSDQAVPGAMVRVRFGGQRVNGIIWDRVASSETPASSLRYIERVLTPSPLVSASMREDITLIADAYGGTRANILRLAVPARVARIDKEQQLAASGLWQGHERFGEPQSKALADGLAALRRSYDGAERLHAAIEGRGFASFVVDAMPGALRWARDLAYMILDALLAGKSAVIVLPTAREVDDLAGVLAGDCGLRRFAPDHATHGGYSGDFAVLEGSAMPPAERYRAYLAVSTGQVRCVIGARSAMYAPVEGPALFAIVDDLAYQNMDGFMPYPNARGVLRLRAKAHGGVFVALANARSPISQWETNGDGDPSVVRETPTSGFSSPVRPLPAVLKESSPWIRWLNRDELARLADPSIGARVPHTAVRILTEALRSGPVLLSIPADGIAQALSCARCHRQARCARCTGPLEQVVEQSVKHPGGMSGGIRCRWCGAAAVNWTCPGCHGDRLRVVRVGAAGTAQELAGLFRGVPIVMSSRSQPRGIIASIVATPQIVIATPGCEPRVLQTDGKPGEYRAVAILDAWTSLYAPGVDARCDALSSWMRSMTLCAPRSRGGQGLLIGETDPVIARSLMLWNPTLLAGREIEERAQTGLPPVVAAACVWGRRDAVMKALSEVGVLDGDWANVTVRNVIGDDEPTGDPGDGSPDGTAMTDGPLDMPATVDLPAVLGPVPIPQPATINARELEDTADRVKAVIRVGQPRRAELAIRLRAVVARHVASRTPGELRFRLDPKDLI